MLNYPVFTTLLTKQRDVSQLIATQRSKGVDVATSLYLEWKLASANQDVFIRERIATILFELIVSRALDKWLGHFLAANAITLVPQDFEDWKSAAMVKIWMGKNYNPDRPFLSWAFVVARYCWIDERRKSYAEMQYSVPYDEELLDEWQEQETIAALSAYQISNPEAQAIITDFKERIIRLMKTGGSKKILWAVSAGIPWHSTMEIAAVTGLTLPQVKKEKEQIKQTLRMLRNEV